MGYGSTIRAKKGKCDHPGCAYYGELIGGKCQNHYWLNRRLKSAAKFEAKELQQNESLSAVIEDLDAVFSQYIRLRDSDENGYVTCYCECGRVMYWTDAQCMHFRDRDHMNTRFSEDACKAGCEDCNCRKDGNIKAFGEHLERDRPGSVEAIEEQARSLYKYDVPELKSLIAYYAKEVRVMKAKKPLKI